MTESLPSWERGLKSIGMDQINSMRLSLPSWERGLKSVRSSEYMMSFAVAPLVGAWIEIANLSGFHFTENGRSPRGSVD